MVNSLRKQSIRKPIAVCISDIHYNLQTLSIADEATTKAIDKANELEVPLIVAGDAHDSKANMRGECVNAMIKTFRKCNLPPYLIVGNHSRLNEKSPEHALNFLREYATIIDQPCVKILELDLYMLPYNHNPEALTMNLSTIPKGSTLIMHQGLKKAASGDYIQDHSAILPQDVSSFRVISGHYHTRQTIRTGYPEFKGDLVGTWDYIGNPYTLNYGEANDPPKGFQVLYDDGSLEFVPTNLRRHIVINAEWSDRGLSHELVIPELQDLVWIKVKGPAHLLNSKTKEQYKELMFIPGDFKLELIPNDIETLGVSYDINISPNEALDSTIDSSNLDSAQKNRVKNLWKELVK